MSRRIKDFRTNFMYWRFRYITRNRMRLQSAYYRRRQPRSRTRPRGGAAFVYRRSPRRTWLILLVMVVLLTALSDASRRGYVNGSVDYALSSLVVVLSIYTALKAF
ncbi:MAG: hypothetical protein ACR2JC_12705 [Chloroflexota bacterium]|nr:MAG: hypothetical protein DLM70_11395 [Chloroflexota bacterium]